MDMDLEHTRPHPVPSKEYLAAARLSIEEFVKPRLSRLNQKYGGPQFPMDDQDPEGKGFPPPPPGFHKGHWLKDPDAPEDKNYYVLIAITVFGLVHMLPMMFFFTANEYWMYKFRNTTSNSTDANDRTYLQTYFASLTSFTVTTPGVICNFIAAVAGHKIKASIRVFFVLIVHLIILIIQAIFVNIDTDTWQTEFFVFILMTELVMSCAQSLGGSGSMGLIAKLPPVYMKAKLMGEGASAIVSSLLRLLCIFVTPSTTSAALLYFTTGSVLMLVAIVVFYLATTTVFFKYYTRTAKEDVKDSLRDHKDFLAVLKLIWPLIILALVGMLMPYGSITNLVVSEYYGTDNVWGTKYFVTVCTFVIPAFTGLIGRGLFNGFDIDLSIPVLAVVTLSREAIFASLLLLSNAKPRHHLPVVLNHDWQYALVSALHSLTSGFLMNLSMIKSMRMVPPHRIELGMMVTMFFFSIFSAATSPLGVLVVSLL